MKGPLARPPADLAPSLLAFSVGVCLTSLPTDLPGPWAWLGLLVLAFGLARWPRAWPLVALLLGFAWAGGQAAWELGHRLPARLEGQDLQLIGRVEGLPERRGEGTRFLFQVERVQTPAGPADFVGRVRLTWFQQAQPLWPGERWQLQTRLKVPHGLANGAGFDYGGWLFQAGIRATGYVRGQDGHRRLEPAGLTLDGVRQGLRERLQGVLGDHPATGLVLALTLGDRSAIPPPQWEALLATGTNHLVAISGLHVGILAGLGFMLGRALWRRSPRLSLILPAPRGGAALGLLLAAGYAALAGFAISTQRALIMLAVVLGALLLGRAPRPASGLLAALVLVLVLDPLACLSAAFWLSFGAVAALLYGMGQRVGQGGLAWQWGRAQVWVALGLLPPLLWLFGQVSLVGPLANLIAVPLFSLALLPAVLISAPLALVGLTWPLLGVAQLLDWACLPLVWLAAQPWALWTPPQPPLWAWVLAIPGVLLLLGPRGLPGRWLGLWLLAPLVLVPAPVPPPGSFRFTLLDVGQGLAALVRTHRHVLLFDTGPAYPGGFNTGAAVILPVLRARGIGRVDRLILSHADTDHAGGLTGLLGKLTIADVLSGEPDQIRGVTAVPCRRGMHWRWDGVEFRILHPTDTSAGTGNDRSCVLQVRNGAGAVLITGDVGTRVERGLVRELGAELRSQVLVAGHHGSAGSSSPAFLEAVAPAQVWFSAGYRNRYGFPKPQVLERVRSVGAEILNTAQSGALELDFQADGRLDGPRQQRQTGRRYWTHRGEGEGENVSPGPAFPPFR